MSRQRGLGRLLAVAAGAMILCQLAGCTGSPDQGRTFVEDFARQLLAAYLF